MWVAVYLKNELVEFGGGPPVTVDRDIAQRLLDPAEIERLEAIGLDLPANSVAIDSYHVALLHYAERIMFSPWVSDTRRPGDNFDLALSDRASEELSRIRQEIERLDRKIHGKPIARDANR